MALMDRAKNIVLQPKTEWPVIDAEQTSVAALYTGYIIPLAAIGPVARFIGWSFIGMRIPFAGSIRVPILAGLRIAVVEYIGWLVGAYVLALVIDALAPTFGGTKNQIQALKVTTYSMTAAWLALAFDLIPALAFLKILGLYSLFLLFLGLPILMKSPEDKAMGYTVVVIIVAIVLAVVINYFTTLFYWTPGPMGMPSL
jgi:Yip1-like protein